MSISELTALPDDILGKETRQRFNNMMAAFTELNRRGFYISHAGVTFKNLHLPDVKPLVLRISKSTTIEL